MPKAKAVWRSLFDVRPGEYPRTLFMALYLFFVMVAYYILKPVSAAMFLHKFDINKLPYLYILIAAGGGCLAYFYTRVALKFSLMVAVTRASAIAVLCLVALWWLTGLNLSWMLYVFNVWVSLFSIVLVSQGWLVAANVFDTREAKRLYGLLGLGAVAGGGIGSVFTRFTVKLVGSHNLILACVLMVILAYVSFRLAVRDRAAGLAQARAAKETSNEFSFPDLFQAIGRHRHLQVIIGVILVTFLVDELTDFQFQFYAKQAYRDRAQLTAFMAMFNAYLSIPSFCLQFFLTAWVLRRVGVGGTLRIAPLTITAFSVGSVAMPGLVTATATRMIESLNRYTLNKTGMELLYLPLPADLRNRTKTFMDIFVDRAGRGVAGILLGFLVWMKLGYPRAIALVVIGFTLLWLLLARRAQREYLGTVTSRLERRRLDLESSRVPVNDPAMLALLEQTVSNGQPRQVCYALGLLAEAPDYDLNPMLERLASSPSAEVRAKVYEIAWFVGYDELVEPALAKIRTARRGEVTPALKPAVVYALSFADRAEDLALEWIDHPNALVAESALESLRTKPELMPKLISEEWLTRAVQDGDPQRRYLAAVAIAILGEEGALWLPKLLEDRDTTVVAAACRTAGVLRNRACVHAIVRRLANARLRVTAIESLAAYGTSIVGYLGDILADEGMPLSVRRQIPRVLKLVEDQRSVDVLVKCIGQRDLAVRAAVLRALTRLREAAPRLDYGDIFVTEQILQEARHYFELYAALEPFREQRKQRTAAGLLHRSLEERLQQTLERLFRLLGLRYPPIEMQSAWLAVHHRRKEQFLAALEFLDNVLEPRLKRVVLPMLDSSEQLVQRGRDLFGLEARDAESAVRVLLRSDDPWLAACAAATAGERRLRALAPEIATLGQQAGADVSQVARAAAMALS